MNQSKIHNFLIQNVSALDGVGIKIKKLLKKKKIEKISDLLWNLPQGFTDRSNVQTLDKLEIGKITTIKVKVTKYNFPRIRNLPNKVTCEDKMGKIDIVFFNSREGYIRKILPLNSLVIISGKINYYRKKYQITNPTYVVPIDMENYVNKIIPKYSLTEGLTEKVYRKLIEKVLKNITDLTEWHDGEILKNESYVFKKNIPLKIFKSWVQQTNIFQYLGVHYVDIIHFVTGAKPLRVTAVGQKNFLKNNGIDTFDAIEVVVEWKKYTNTFSSTFLCNWIDPNNTSAVSYQSIKFIGTKGRIESDQKNRGLQLVTDREGIEDINPYFNQNYTIENNVFFKGYGIESFLQFFQDC